MANAGTITLIAGSVNGGVAVDLNANGARYAYSNNLKADPIASSYALTEVEHRGFENPRLVVNGVIRDIAGVNEVTEKLLKQFAKVKGEELILKMVTGSTGNESTFSNANGVTDAGSSEGIPLTIETFNIEIDVKTIRDAHNLHYTINFIEDSV